MTKDKLYLLTLVSLAIITLSISYYAIEHSYQISETIILENQLESSKREAKEIASLIESQLKQGISEEEVIQNLQKAIEGRENRNSFICMYNSSGIELCHPNIDKIGKSADSTSIVKSLKKDDEQSFQNLIKNGKSGGGLRSFNDENTSSEIIYAQAVYLKPWMVASHANIHIIRAQLESLKKQFFNIQIISSLLAIILTFLSVRWIASKYENQIETEKEDLTKEITNLATLNSSLINQQKQLSTESSIIDTIVKQRILIHWRDQIIPIDVKDISYFYTSSSITKIYCSNKNIYHAKRSLDEYYNQLDNKLFFRANRQILVSINSIKKIFRYGKNQLKLEIFPKPPVDVIISKNKIAEFKDWLSTQKFSSPSKIMKMN